ncbi:MULTISPECIES: nicotinate-nucleotide adenylyltransferase [unclassified Sphingomonas]|jgi:nicotinate-nucleotide adenylyltransferase|uniref:nicotinate-nucleotide adenylyltransferase n=1 Tax=unclassified Sphingomonas TaxID=196159 RepID=UPI000AC9A7CD|nr:MULTISPECIES: nicotinate-nucleotide adenylyltransferase [unclassified Sphingomonas]
MGGAGHGAGAALKRIGLLGGSFNPAHLGHRKLSLHAIRALGLDEVWWLVSPGNPLKDKAGMAPFKARMASAGRMARHAPIRVSDIEKRIKTRYTADTIRKLPRLFPRHRFIWLMGADNLAQFHKWERWREIAEQVPIAVIARPGYDRDAHASPAMGWLRRAVRPAGQAKNWTRWRLPALVLLRFRPDPTSATSLRAADPAWHRRYAGARQSVTLMGEATASSPQQFRTDKLQP